MKTKSSFIIIAALITVSSVAQETGVFTDSRDGKTYKTVEIYGRTWMAENLAYRLSEGCWAYKNDTSYVATYGYLYNWKTAMNACPPGWHLPNSMELGSIINQGINSKEIGDSHWKKSNKWVGTNKTGFTALPGGNRSPAGLYGLMGKEGFWWSSTSYSAFGAWNWGLNYYSPKGERYEGSVYRGFSVRCIKDEVRPGKN